MRTDVTRRRAAEVRRVDILRALPDALARALPHVRVFSLGPCKAALNECDRSVGRSEKLWESLNPDFCVVIKAQDAVDEEWGEMSSQVDEHLRELRRRADETAGLRDEQWWWVEGEGKERRAIGIWKEKGEWARDVIEDMDFDTKTGLNASIPPTSPRTFHLPHSTMSPYPKKGKGKKKATTPVDEYTTWEDKDGEICGAASTDIAAALVEERQLPNLLRYLARTILRVGGFTGPYVDAAAADYDSRLASFGSKHSNGAFNAITTTYGTLCEVVGEAIREANIHHRELTPVATAPTPTPTADVADAMDTTPADVPSPTPLPAPLLQAAPLASPPPAPVLEAAPVVAPVPPAPTPAAPTGVAALPARPFGAPTQPAPGPAAPASVPEPTWATVARAGAKRKGKGVTGAARKGFVARPAAAAAPTAPAPPPTTAPVAPAKAAPTALQNTLAALRRCRPAGSARLVYLHAAHDLTHAPVWSSDAKALEVLRRAVDFKIDRLSSNPARTRWTVVPAICPRDAPMTWDAQASALADALGRLLGNPLRASRYVNRVSVLYHHVECSALDDAGAPVALSPFNVLRDAVHRSGDTAWSDGRATLPDTNTSDFKTLRALNGSRLLFDIGPRACTLARVPDRPLQCSNCQQFGHTAVRCRAPPACGFCAGSHHTHHHEVLAKRPGPTVHVANGTTDRLKSMLSLNDDVLLLIVSFLSRKDALAVACTSKYAYCLATPSSLYDASYPYSMRDPEMSRWEYLLGYDKFLGVPRRRYVRGIAVSIWPEDENEMASLLEALPSFSNLQSLYCDYTSELIERHPRFVERIPNLVQLTEIGLYDLRPTILPNLASILASPHLTTVTIFFRKRPKADAHWNASQAFVLLSTLAALPSLCTLSLMSVAIPFPPRSTTMHTIPMISSLRHLTVIAIVDTSANIAGYCPNLTTLEMGFWIDGMALGYDQVAHLSVLTKDVWPSIRELDYSMPRPTSFTNHLGRASKVTIHYKRLDDYGDYLPILSKTRPSCLHLISLICDDLHSWPSMDQFETEQDLIKYAWKELANTLPQLRSLLLSLEYTALTEDFVTILLDALRPLPLTHFSLWAPARYTALTSEHTTTASTNKRRTTEVHRVDTLRALPDALTRALPHVRVFSLGPYKAALDECDRRAGRSERFWEFLNPDFWSAMQAQDAVDEEWGEMSSQVDEHLRELRRRAVETAGLRDERWWWVEREGEERRAIEIWKEKGEWARYVIESVDFQPGDLTGMFHNSWCYDP
ncbi:uncharacterized protein BXZ73DRAFT_109044 [Epithele typhae]|uniref:uncharacterized protein n=1 Tax=Epithele typhae TaxID=378194 RepID=UPI002007528B|nr:uncharacterized protein BXZ73DRAFT_109044 [Epithele typhae]KAH9910411.1 hypothetical protein BXZ73DRAFT_109044 [Epithele typhae]